MEQIKTEYSVPVFDDFLSEVRRRFETEKNAKNISYSFIIQMGLLRQFREFAEHYKSLDHHEACIDMLDMQSRTEQR